MSIERVTLATERCLQRGSCTLGYRAVHVLEYILALSVLLRASFRHKSQDASTDLISSDVLLDKTGCLYLYECISFYAKHLISKCIT